MENITPVYTIEIIEVRTTTIYSFCVINCYHPQWWWPISQFSHQIWLAAVSFFILVNMGWLIIILGWPQLSVLNIIKKAMENFNIVCVGMAIHLRNNLPKWFPCILRKSNSVDQMIHEVDAYYKYCTVAIGRIECHKRKLGYNFVQGRNWCFWDRWGHTI